MANAILGSLKNLKVTLDIDSRVEIDDCKLLFSMWKHEVTESGTDATELAFKQFNVTAVVS